MTRNLVLGLLAGASALLAAGAIARDQIRITGSSTVLPFSSTVAENFAARQLRGPNGRPLKTPIVESTGTGGGIKQFCAGVGPATPDIANASRRMRASEFKECQTNGVRDIVEIKIGYDGIVLANKRGGPPMDINKAQLWLALAKEVPSRGRMIPNPFVRWSDIDRRLPNEKISVFGPPPTSGTRDAWNELALEKGADMLFARMGRTQPAIAAIAADEDRFEQIANTMREDGGWNDAGENDNAIVQSLTRNPDAFGVFGFSFYIKNRDRVQAAKIDGAYPDFNDISDRSYALSRDMFIYIKAAHVGVIPGLREFATEFMSNGSVGPRGYLRTAGMVPLLPAEIEQQRTAIRAMQPVVIN
jgi:phosphate transport system substrate-binding protein